MKGERGNFKGRVFGGFNRHDVIDYIETLAAQRNELSRDNEKLREQVEALEERLDAEIPPINEPEAEREDGRRELRDALEEARQVLSGVKSEYDAICTDIKINAAQTNHELKLIAAKLTGLQDSLSAAGERLEAIGAELSEETGE